MPESAREIVERWLLERPRGRDGHRRLELIVKAFPQLDHTSFPVLKKWLVAAVEDALANARGEAGKEGDDG